MARLALRTWLQPRVKSKDGKSHLPEKPTTSVYRPLDPSKKEIRILKVDRNTDWKGRIKCRSELASLLSNPQPVYEAISWCWGNGEQKTRIILDGRVVPVPVNAERVLRRLCVDQGYDRVWLDAVSIDQEDDKERGHQVAIMCDVYSRAKRVLIWLGEANKTTESAVQSLDKILQQCREETGHLEDIRKQFYDEQENPVYSDLTLPHCDWRAVSRFYGSRWFTRLWVIQEVILSKEAFCFYGRTVRTWEEVSLAAKWMEYANSWRYMGNLPFKGIKNAAEMWDTEHSKLELINLLRMAIFYQTTFPVDKVYGTFGLFRSSDPPKTAGDLTPDCNKTLREVYTTATRAAMLEAEEELNCFSLLGWAFLLVPPPDHESIEESLPSWVPRYDWIYNQRWGSPSQLESRLFSASSSLGRHAEPVSGNYLIEGDILYLRGVVVDRVTQSGNTFSPEILRNIDKLVAEVRAVQKKASGTTADQLGLAVTLTSGSSLADNNAEKVANLHAKYKEFIGACNDRKGTGSVDDEGKISGEEQMSDEEFLKRANPYREALSVNRRFFKTSGKYIGMGPPGMQNDDFVCLLLGSPVPLVLRKEERFWKLVGDAYVYGAMHGNYLEPLQREGRLEEETQTFAIH